MDAVIIRSRGIVGKHAGDGVSAYFLNDEFESPSEAAATAIDAAHELRRAALATADQIGRETGLFTAADCPLNVGVHWGSTLYMGQVVTGGRLEVTALGDEVNECARIQQSARDGAVLASKAVIERLVDGDATPRRRSTRRPSSTARSPTCPARTRRRSATPARCRSPSCSPTSGSRPPP